MRPRLVAAAVPQGESIGVETIDSSGRVLAVLYHVWNDHVWNERMPTPITALSIAIDSQSPLQESADSVWSLCALKGHSVSQHHNGIVATIDLEDPTRGIACQRQPMPAGTLDAATACDILLGLDIRSECHLTEHWLRANDVTAVYESTDARCLRVTAMWRWRPSQAMVHAWELVVSVQTSLEQSDSSLRVSAHVDAAVVLWGRQRNGSLVWSEELLADATAVLLRRGAPLSTLANSVFFCVHPEDLRQLLVRRDLDSVHVEYGLFSSAVEKGVLLRSRVLAATGPASNDTDWAATLFSAFTTAPPLLST